MFNRVEGKRIKLDTVDGKSLFYDIDGDGKIYWLRLHKISIKGKLDVHVQRYRVRDPKLLEQIEEIVERG